MSLKSGVFLCLFFSLVTRLESQELSEGILPIFKSLTIEDGLSNNEVKHIVQDRQGFIWFATGSGIDRYDGYKVVNFHPKLQDSTSDEKISWRPLKMVIDDLNNFYLASDFGGLMIIDHKKNLLTHLTEQNSKLPSNSIYDMVWDQNENIWLATSNGISRLDLSTKKIETLGKRENAINRVQVDNSRTVWFSSPGMGSYFYQPHTEKPLQFSEKAFEGIYPLSSDSILLGGGNEIYIYKKTIAQLKVHGHLPEGARISDILRDRKRNIWIGTYNQGVFYINASTGKLFQFTHQPGNKQSIISEHIASLYEDKHSNIWIGTYGDGVSVISADLDQIKIVQQSTPEQNTGNSIQQIMNYQNQIVYHNGQHIYQITNDPYTGKVIISANDKMCREISAMGVFGKELLIAGGCDVFSWDTNYPDALKNILIDFPELPRQRILSIAGDYPHIFLSSSHTNHLSGWWDIDLGTMKSMNLKDDDQPGSLSGNQATATLVSSTGDIWIATWDDLNLYRRGSMVVSMESVITECNCLKGGSTVLSIFEDHRGLIWFGRIDNGGLVVIDPATLQNNCFRLEQGLPDNSVTSILQDSAHNLWLGTYRGIVKLIYPDDPLHTSRLDIQIIDQSNGLPNSTIWNGCTDNQGHLYFGTRDGLILIEGDQIKIKRNAPRILISGFHSESMISPLQPSGSDNPEMIELNAHDKVFSIDFAIDDQYQSEFAAYNYRFANLDTQWIDINRQHSLSFPNLSPGHYELEIRSRLLNSDWSLPRKFLFTIIPPVYRRWWFLMTVFSLTLILVYYLQQYRINQLKKIHRLREQISSDLHDEIGSALTNIEIIGGIAVRTEKKNRTAYEKIITTARSSNEALHQIVWNLNPTYDQVQNLVPYLANYAARTLDDSGISLKLDQDLGNRPFTLDIDRRKDLNLAFKEAINNIVRHSKATEVKILFTIRDKMLQIAIRDNGISEAMEITPGNGLRNIEHRMSRSGGKLKYERCNPTGFEVLLDIPVT
ncbi:MAG: hypothetical protein KDC80_22050 [Saprospiraceae bacterium]|nr:hypothetical protein [Saprospiraceae bacterium]